MLNAGFLAKALEQCYFSIACYALFTPFVLPYYPMNLTTCTSPKGRPGKC